MAQQVGRTIHLELEHDPTYTGEVKSLGDRQGPILKASGCYISVVIVHIVHGFLGSPEILPERSQNENEPASLVVIRFELSMTSSSNKRLWHSFTPRITIEASPPSSDPEDEPWIDVLEPAGRGKIYISESESTITNEQTGELSAQGGWQPFGSLGAKWTKSTTEEVKRISRYTIETGGEVTQSRGAGRQGRDKVFWNLRENALNRGVGDRLQVAMIVRRTKDAPKKFIMYFRLEAEVDLKYDLAKLAQKAKGKKKEETRDKSNVSEGWHGQKNMSWLFDVDKSDEVLPDNVDATNLSRMVRDGTLGRLAYEHSPEKVLSETLYNPDMRHSPNDNMPIAVAAPASSETSDDAGLIQPLLESSSFESHYLPMVFCLIGLIGLGLAWVWGSW